jgi:hypothetical protein
MAVTEVLYFLEIPQSVSPFLIVWRMGGLRLGLTLTVGRGLGRDATVVLGRGVGVAVPPTGGRGRGLVGRAVGRGVGVVLDAMTGGVTAAIELDPLEVLLRHLTPLLLSLAQRST